MKAIQISEYGSPEVLKVVDIPIKNPMKGYVLLRIAIAGVNFVDTYQRRGIYPVSFPYVLGLEGSGTVEAVGEGVENVKVGDRVAYVHPSSPETGSYAEFALVRDIHLIVLPKEVSFELGAAFPLQGMTAHYLLHEFRSLQPNDVVLIHAAAGGMGLLLVQWAKHLGLRVLGTTSTEEKAAIAKKAGADEVILYSKQDFVTEVKRLTDDHGADFIIDGVGRTTFPGNLEACALRGNIVIFGAASGVADPISPNVLMRRSLTVSGGMLFNYMLTRDEFMKRAQAVLIGIQKGFLQFRIDEVFALEKAASAHKKLEGRHTSGKVLLKT